MTTKHLRCCDLCLDVNALCKRLDLQKLTFKSQMKTMEQHIFVFATRGQCIKGKQIQHVTIKNKIIKARTIFYLRKTMRLS